MGAEGWPERWSEGWRGGILSKTMPCAVFFEKDHVSRREISKIKQLHRFFKNRSVSRMFHGGKQKIFFFAHRFFVAAQSF